MLHQRSLSHSLRRYSCLVDCALYFTHTFAERGGSSGQTASTLLLDQSIVKLVERAGGGGGVGEQMSPLAETLCEAQLNGVSIDTVVCYTDAVISSFANYTGFIDDCFCCQFIALS